MRTHHHRSEQQTYQGKERVGPALRNIELDTGHSPRGVSLSDRYESFRDLGIERRCCIGRIVVHEFITLDGVIDNPAGSMEYGFDPKMGGAIATE